MIQIYVIEDQFLIVAGLKAIFHASTESFKITGYSNRIDEAVEQINCHPVDIIILDLFLKVNGPVANIRKLKSEFPKIPVIILTKDSSLYWKTRMFFEGAQAYLVKDVLSVTIKNTIKFVSEGITLVPPEVNRILEYWKLDNEKNVLKSEDLDIIFDISCGLNPKQVAQKYNKSLSTIEKNLEVIRAKFNAKTNTELIRIFFS